MPFPITIPTRSQLLWEWHVNGVTDASYIELNDPPAGPGGFKFERGRRFQVNRRWDQMFRLSDTEWKRAEPGEYTIGVCLNVDNAKQKGLYDETTIRVVQS